MPARSRMAWPKSTPPGVSGSLTFLETNVNDLNAKPLPRCGDRMKRIGPNARPDDDGYVLAYWDPDSDACAMSGWPESYDRQSEFELVEACSDTEHAEAVASWLMHDGRRDRGGCDHRWWRVRELYGHILQPISQNQAFEVALVREFHKAFDHEAPERPQRFFAQEKSWQRWRFVEEEALELIHALSVPRPNLIAVADALVDLAYFCAGTLVCLGVRAKHESESFRHWSLDGCRFTQVCDLADHVRHISMAFRARDAVQLRALHQDALINLSLWARGMGIPWKECFYAVHAANMRKLWPDGKPHRNEHGKSIKPDGWYGPERELEQILKTAGVL